MSYSIHYIANGGQRFINTDQLSLAAFLSSADLTASAPRTGDILNLTESVSYELTQLPASTESNWAPLTAAASAEKFNTLGQFKGFYAPGSSYLKNDLVKITTSGDFFDLYQWRTTRVATDSASDIANGHLILLLSGTADSSAVAALLTDQIPGLVMQIVVDNGQIVDSKGGKTITVIDPDNVDVVGSAIRFNNGVGAGYLQVADVFRQFSYTKAGWFKADQVTTAMHLITKLTGEGANTHSLLIQAGEIRAGHNSDWQSSLTVPVYLDKNERIHIAQTFDADDRTEAVFVNGRKLYERASDPGVYPALDTPLVGGLNIGSLEGSDVFQGTMEDIRLYDRRLTDAEVQALVQSYYDDSDQIGLLTEYDIVLVFGQSNSIGENNGPYLKGVGEADKIDPNVYAMTRGYVFTYQDTFTNSNGALHITEEPIQHIFTDQLKDRVGPALQFGKLMTVNSLKKGRKVLIIPCGYPGSSFSDGTWMPGGSWYNDAVERVNYAIRRYNGVLKAMLWHQGEADALAAGSWPSNYAANLKNMVDTMRAAFVPDADSTDHSDTPFICGTMVSAWVGVDSDRLLVDAAHRNVATSITNAGFVDLAAQASEPGDLIHYSAAAQRNFGLLAHPVYTAIRGY